MKPHLFNRKVTSMPAEQGDYARSRTRLIFHHDELAYDFGAEHPLKPRRLVALLDLLETGGLLRQDDAQQLPIRPATVEELRLVHTADYIDAVQRLSTLKGPQDQELALQYGLGEGDTPIVLRASVSITTRRSRLPTC